MLPGSSSTAGLPSLNNPTVTPTGLPVPSNMHLNPSNNAALTSGNPAGQTGNAMMRHNVSDLVTVDPNATYTTQSLQRELQVRVLQL